MKSTLALLIALVSALSLSLSASAINIATVPIGNPGNPAEFGIGSVAQSFSMGKTEITNAQYVAFLNAVGAADPYGLYAPQMTSQPQDGIIRSGSAGNYTYTLKSAGNNGAYSYDNKPVEYVSSADAMRFANWLHNGQPTGPENAATTEDGAYTLNGMTETSPAIAALPRNPGARWWLPSNNEWYKAAYYDPSANVYYDFPTGTNFIPNNHPPAADTGNSVNRFDGASGYATQSLGYPLTDVGAYTNSASPYGTYDQGGNVWEWTDTDSGGGRIARGGSYQYDSSYMNADSAFSTLALAASDQRQGIGFRVATIAVPESSTIILAILGLTALPTSRRRSK